MAGRWALAFAVAAVIAILGAALLRACSRRGVSGVRRRGALAIAVGAACGWAFLPDLPGRIAVIAGSTLALALLGAAFSGREPPRGARLVALTIAAIAVVAAGVRLDWSGLAVLNVAGTIAVIVVVAIATRWLATTDGAAASVTAACFAGVFALAAFADQDALATLAVATTGACVGFLAYNLPPARVLLNKDGALFLGFLVAVLAIDVQPAIARPGALEVPLLLLAIPLLEITLVPLAQLRRRKHVRPERRDHLVHRLRALGLGRRSALFLLAAAQLLLSGVAVFVGRSVVTPLAGLAAGVAVVASIAIAAVVKDVYGERVLGFSRRFKVAILGLGTLAVLVAIPAGIAAVRTQRNVDDARRLVKRGISAARDGDTKTARTQFAAAAHAFEDARGSLDNPLVSASLALPVVGSNVQAARELADIGLDLSRTGEQVAGRVDPDRLQVINGTVPLDEVHRVTPELERSARELNRAAGRLKNIDDAFLVSPVGKALGDVDRQVTSASREADNGLAAARLAPAIFGGDGPRRYFIAVQNPAESRATGGFPGFWGILSSEGGKVHLEQLQPISVLNPAPGATRTLNAPTDYVRRYSQFFPELSWQNVNMSPDFPTVARIMIDQYRQATGQQVDGVMAVDPAGLAALLKLTGPVNVAGWPEPLTSNNVVRITLNEAYAQPRAGRQDFLGDAAHDIVERATSGSLGKPATIAKELGKTAREGHLILAFTRPEEEDLALKFGVAGNVPVDSSDSLLVTTQNRRANKIDYYLRRRMAYSVRLDPVGGNGVARLSGRVEVGLDNAAPDTGLPATVIGTTSYFGESLEGAGENGMYLSVYTPMGMTAATFEGNQQPLDSTTELQRKVYAGNVSVPAGSTRTLAIDLRGTVHLERDGSYTLDLVRQPNITPDEVSVSIEVPPGWRLVDGHGLKADGDRHATAHLQLNETTRLRVRLVPAKSNVWQRLLDGE